MLVVAVAVACFLPPTATVFTPPRAVLDASRSTMLAMRGAADDRAQVLVDNGLVRALRRWVGGGEKEKDKEIVCGQSRYGCDPRLADQPLSLDSLDATGTLADAAEVGNCDDRFPEVEAGIVGQLYGGLAQLHALLELAGEGTVVLKFKRKGCPACNSTIAPASAGSLRGQGHLS